MKLSKPVIMCLYHLDAISDVSPPNLLDAEERLFFYDLIIRWSQYDKVWVRDLLSDRRYHSSTTAYRRLMTLRDKGLVSLQVPKEDRRQRYVLPTEAALLYISCLEVAVDQFVSDRAHYALHL